MNSLTDYIRAKQIDSYQKLRVLLLMHQRPHLKATVLDLATHLHLNDTVLLEKIIADLQQVGLIDCSYTLQTEPETQTWLPHLAAAFEHPLTRQTIIDQIRAKGFSVNGPSLSVGAP